MLGVDASPNAHKEENTTQSQHFNRQVLTMVNVGRPWLLTLFQQDVSRTQSRQKVTASVTLQQDMLRTAIQESISIVFLFVITTMLLLTPMIVGL